MDTDLRAFLGRTYELKAIADYGIDPASKVSKEMAAAAIVTSKRFVAKMVELIEDPAPDRP
jgi:hypothetical protein